MKFLRSDLWRYIQNVLVNNHDKDLQELIQENREQYYSKLFVRPSEIKIPACECCGYEKLKGVEISEDGEHLLV